MKVAAPPLGLPCERPVTYPGDILTYWKIPRSEEWYIKRFLWRIYTARSKKNYLDLHSYFNQICVSRQFFIEAPNTKVHGNSSSGSRGDTCGETKMTKLRRTFGDYMNADKNKYFSFR
jgi:hypothetical protein